MASLAIIASKPNPPNPLLAFPGCSAVFTAAIVLLPSLTRIMNKEKEGKL